MLAGLFVATTEEAGALRKEADPVAEFGGVEANWFRDVEAARLLMVFTDRPIHVAIDRAISRLRTFTGDGPWLDQIGSELVRALADVDEGALADIAQEWGSCEELAHVSAVEVQRVLKGAVALANRARESSAPVFVWVTEVVG